VQALQWDAGLAWSPLWTLVPDLNPGLDATPAELEYATRERKRLALERLREARWRAHVAVLQRERKAAARQHARQVAFREAARVAQPAADAEPPIWGPLEPPMMEPPPGTRVFRHAIAESGATCITACGAIRCQCGFYRMTWTWADDIG
jgi:hypothetical protein